MLLKCFFSCFAHEIIPELKKVWYFNKRNKYFFSFGRKKKFFLLGIMQSLLTDSVSIIFKS